MKSGISTANGEIHVGVSGIDIHAPRTSPCSQRFAKCIRRIALPSPAQLSNATLRGRETLARVFMPISKSIMPQVLPSAAERWRDGPSAKIDRLAHGMGFIFG
jgi:hypothetical protein